MDNSETEQKKRRTSRDREEKHGNDHEPNDEEKYLNNLMDQYERYKNTDFPPTMVCKYSHIYELNKHRLFVQSR